MNDTAFFSNGFFLDFFLGGVGGCTVWLAGS